MRGEEQTLFGDMSAFEVAPKGRKAPETAIEKRLGEISAMEERDFGNLRNKLDRGQTLTASEARRLEGYRKRYEEISGADRPAHWVSSKEAVAAHFGKTKRTIVNWGHRGMPELTSGYDLAAIGVWALKEGLIQDRGLVPWDGTGEAPGGNGDGESPVEDKNYWETEVKRLQARLKTIELAKTEGDLLPREEVEAGRVARIMAVKRAALAIPRTLAPQLVGLEAREIEAVLMERMRELCVRFAHGEEG